MVCVCVYVRARVMCKLCKRERKKERVHVAREGR